MKRLFTFALLLMAIGVNAEKANINIKTQSTQLVLQVKDDGRLYQTYLGQRLTDDTPLGLLNMPRMSGSSCVVTQGNEVYPVMGTEDFYEPAFEIRHADGNPTSILKYVSHTQQGNETLITLRDELYPVTVVLHYVVYPEEDIIKQWSEISHQEKGKVYISRYASSMLYFEAEQYFLPEVSSEWIR